MATETTESLELVKFTAESWRGIDASKPVIIDFTKMRKTQHFVEFVGDEDLNKTNTLTGIMYAICVGLNIPRELMYNLTDGTIKEDLEFNHEGMQYKIECRNERISLKVWNDNTEKWVTDPDGEPVAKIRRIFGPVGMSPFVLQTMKGKEQIEYIQKIFGSGEDTKKKHKELDTAYDELFDKRRDVNRDITKITGALKLEPLYMDRENSEKKFKEPIVADKERKAYEEISNKNREYLDYKDNKLPDLNKRLLAKQQDIADLEKRLAAARQEETTISDAVKKYNEWVEANKKIPADFKKAQTEWNELSDKLIEQNKWNEILEKEKDLHKMQKASERATGQLIDLDTQMLKLTRSYLPKIEGLKLKVKPSLDKEKEEIGLFYNDLSMGQINESKFAKLWAKIYIEKGMNFLFFENLSDLGSSAVEMLNELGKEPGVVIFYTLMDRKKKKMEINFKTKIE